ncbi:MAG TPA: hypothetical protein VFA18_02455, partial [Gemmataceae bacterium]|nr:hypothetical protein [Gemmataceae bacterium]
RFTADAPYLPHVMLACWPTALKLLPFALRRGPWACLTASASSPTLLEPGQLGSLPDWRARPPAAPFPRWDLACKAQQGVIVMSATRGFSAGCGVVGGLLGLLICVVIWASLSIRLGFPHVAEQSSTAPAAAEADDPAQEARRQELQAWIDRDVFDHYLVEDDRGPSIWIGPAFAGLSLARKRQAVAAFYALVNHLPKDGGQQQSPTDEPVLIWAGTRKVGSFSVAAGLELADDLKSGAGDRKD